MSGGIGQCPIEVLVAPDVETPPIYLVSEGSAVRQARMIFDLQFEHRS